MMWDTTYDARYLPRGLPNIYYPSLRTSPLPLYLRTPAVAQFSCKLSGCGCEKQMLPSRVLNRTIASFIAYTAAVIGAQACMNNSGCSFIACSKIDKALCPMCLSWCANIFVLSWNILLQSKSRPSHWKKQLTDSSFLVWSSSELLLLLLGMAGWVGFGVPFCLGSVHFSEVIPASLPVGADGVVLASFSAGADWILPVSFLLGAGGIILASFSVGVLVPSSDPSLARSIKNPPTLLPSFSISFHFNGGVGGGSILL